MIKHINALVLFVEGYFPTDQSWYKDEVQV